MKSRSGIEAKVTWLPYFLNPSLPGGKGKNKLESYKQKFGASRVAAMIPRMEKVGKEEGIAFSYGGNIGNTMDSHRLIEWAGKISSEKQDAVVEALMSSYFEKEECLSDMPVLLSAAEKAGLEGAKEFLESDKLTDDVTIAVSKAQSEWGVSGVPFFVIDNKYAFSGAQDPETIANVLERAAKEQETS